MGEALRLPLLNVATIVVHRLLSLGPEARAGLGDELLRQG